MGFTKLYVSVVSVAVIMSDNMGFNVIVRGTKGLITTVTQEVKRDSLGLYQILCECGCNYE